MISVVFSGRPYSATVTPVEGLVAITFEHHVSGTGVLEKGAGHGGVGSHENAEAVGRWPRRRRPRRRRRRSWWWRGGGGRRRRENVLWRDESSTNGFLAPELEMFSKIVFVIFFL